MIQELWVQHLINAESKANFHCKVFEDNSGALEIARIPQMQPRTKHINLIYNRFLEHARNKEIKIHPISTEYQLADIFTKPLLSKTFLKHRKNMLHW